MNTNPENPSVKCPRSKCGEFNMLRCCRNVGHSGECSFVVDHENDYEWNKKQKKLHARKETK